MLQCRVCFGSVGIALAEFHRQHGAAPTKRGISRRDLARLMLFRVRGRWDRAVRLRFPWRREGPFGLHLFVRSRGSNRATNYLSAGSCPNTGEQHFATRSVCSLRGCPAVRPTPESQLRYRCARCHPTRSPLLPLLRCPTLPFSLPGRCRIPDRAVGPVLSSGQVTLIKLRRK
jgi:hypothetical protein